MLRVPACLLTFATCYLWSVLPQFTWHRRQQKSNDDYVWKRKEKFGTKYIYLFFLVVNLDISTLVNVASLVLFSVWLFLKWCYMVKPLDILIWEGGAEATQKTGTFFFWKIYIFICNSTILYICFYNWLLLTRRCLFCQFRNWILTFWKTVAHVSYQLITQVLNILAKSSPIGALNLPSHHRSIQ